MGLFDSGMINFIKLLIIIGLISMLYMIVMQKIKEQNHKITSLLSVISSMAVEITNLKTPSEAVYEKIDISNDSDSDEYSESDDETSKSDHINFFEISSDEVCEVEPEELYTQNDLDIQSENLDPEVDPEVVPEVVPEVETPKSSQNYKKMSITDLLDIAIKKKLVNKETGSKMRKKDLIDLLL